MATPGSIPYSAICLSAFVKEYKVFMLAAGAAFGAAGWCIQEVVNIEYKGKRLQRELARLDLEEQMHIAKAKEAHHKRLQDRIYCGDDMQWRAGRHAVCTQGHRLTWVECCAGPRR